MRLHIFFDLSKMIDNNLNLSICRVKVNCQIRKLKITKFKEQVMPTYCHIDSTDVIENDYIHFDCDHNEKHSRRCLAVCCIRFTLNICVV
jgi:hypothetical protein